MNISVVIPMYNSETTIQSTLESIRNQSKYKSIVEIIIVNDGSTDKSLDIVNNYSRINKDMPIKIIDTCNQGVSVARNIGIKESRGEWIALLDSDDKWLPNKLEIQIKVIHENPQIDFLGGNIDSKTLRILWRKIDTIYKANVKDLCLKMFPQTSTAIFKRRIFEEIGGYDEQQGYAEDGNYFMKICSMYNYYHIPIQLVDYGCGKPGFGASGLSANLKKMHEGNIKNIKELKENNSISFRFYIAMYMFYWIKHFRRVIITKLRK